MRAWYFARQDEKLAYKDGRKIELGHSHTVSCTPMCCKQGLHGSIQLIDALQYAQSPILYLVEITGKVDQQKDKLCGQRRKYIKRIDASKILREFARKQALINIDKIKPYTNQFELIKRYLETGDENIRAAARSAAESAVESAARYAEGAAAWYAAESAAGAAAWYAEGAAAWYAVESAARSATRSAANDMLTEMVIREIKRS